MNNISLQKVIIELDNLFIKFNDDLFSGELQKPVITVSPDITIGAYGWCTSWKAWKNGDDEHEGYYEINLCSEHLNRPFEDTCSTLLHEMVHLLNLQNGVKDTSRGGTYHNKKFKEVAEQHGLKISQNPKYGWCVTELSEECAAYINRMDGKAFSLYRSGVAKKKNQKPSSSRKYVCPCCGVIIRATKEVKVICSDCDVLFELEI